MIDGNGDLTENPSISDRMLGFDRQECTALQTMSGGDHETSRTTGGLGIGPSLVKRLVQKHGGDVHVHSNGAHQRSEFVVSLPVLGLISSGPLDSQATGADIGPTWWKGKQVIVVDDNDDVANTLSSILDILGARVATLHDETLAIETVRTSGPDAVILDIGLPDVDGYGNPPIFEAA